MLSRKFVRENPEIVRENIRKKYQDDKLALVDEFLRLDEEWKQSKQKDEELRALRNKLSIQVSELKKQKQDATEVLAQVKNIPSQIDELTKRVEEIDSRINQILMTIPNIIHKSVPIGRDSTENVEVEKFGEPKEFDFEVINHAELAEKLGIADFETSAKTTGTGFYYLIGDLARLNQALISFARDYMVDIAKYTYVEPPLMIKKHVVQGVMSFKEMDNMMYKQEGEDLFLIGTSEHSLIGYFIDKVLEEKDLPFKWTSYSMCFRKEIGSHGIDQKGLYRTHQFNKQEMVVICKPEDSYKFYDEMIGHSVEIFKRLELPTRILECCSGDLADLKAKSCDLEAWSPRKKEYFEICSCTNMEEAQARRLNIKYTDGKEKYFAHTLNNTVIATSRALVAILENNQNKDGSVTVPKVLVPYMGGLTVINSRK
ncbi:MAG: serine--tRNA ligase [Candidatus Woesearchaeota archaeon]|jgi:seryl-tRNA synthetase